MGPGITGCVAHIAQVVISGRLSSSGEYRECGGLVKACLGRERDYPQDGLLQGSSRSDQSGNALLISLSTVRSPKFVSVGSCLYLFAKVIPTKIQSSQYTQDLDS